MGTTQEDDVVLVHLADGLHTTLVKGLEQQVEGVLVFEIMGDGLVHQLVAEDGGLTLVAVGNLTPDVTEELLALLALEQPGVSMTIIDVIARLTARAVVHVEDEIEVVDLAPAHHGVDALVAVFLPCQSHIVLVGEELVVKWQTDGIGSLLCDEVDISLGDVVVLELLPELSRFIGTYSLFEEEVDHPGGVGATETEHITFGIQPVAEVRTLDEEFLSIRLDEVMSLYRHKTRRALLPATCCTGSE